MCIRDRGITVRRETGSQCEKVIQSSRNPADRGTPTVHTSGHMLYPTQDVGPYPVGETTIPVVDPVVAIPPPSWSTWSFDSPYSNEDCRLSWWAKHVGEDPSLGDHSSAKVGRMAARLHATNQSASLTTPDFMKATSHRTGDRDIRSDRSPIIDASPRQSGECNTAVNCGKITTKFSFIKSRGLSQHFKFSDSSSIKSLSLIHI